MPAITTIKLRRGTAAQWTAANPVLAAGEVGLETDTLRTKYGNGSQAWSSLSYSVADASGTSAVDWTSVLNKPATFPPSAHTHVKADITDFAHTHVRADITDYDRTDGTVLSDTAPASPVNGLRWIKTTTMQEYVYFDSFWVEI